MRGEGSVTDGPTVQTNPENNNARKKRVKGNQTKEEISLKVFLRKVFFLFIYSITSVLALQSA